MLRGDVRDASVLDRALDGCDAVHSALGIKRKARWNPWSALASPSNFTTMETTLAASTPDDAPRWPSTGKAHLFDHYGLLTRISRGDVAAWMLNAIEQPTPFTRRTPMIGG